MNDISDVGAYFVSKPFIASVIVVCVMVALLTVIKKYLIKKVAYTTKDEQHKNTFVGVIFNILQYAVILGAVVIILQLHGVNVTSIIAGLGIVATLVGLALQDTMKDLISGINIYNNNFYKVGDLVMYNGEMCDVKYFSARVTKFVSMMDGSTYTVCNSCINSIQKVKNITNIFITFDFDEEPKKIEKCFANAIKRVKDEPYLENIVYPGLVNIDAKGCIYCCQIIAPGHKTVPIKIKFIQYLHDEFRKAKISPNFDDERKLIKVK